ncbi:MAG: M24 family metallopeptidase [Legionella sp.]|nr:M24 family metallopeptidase [Legionella sp.]
MNYQARRQYLASHLPADALVVIPAASEQLRNGDSHYKFRQDSDFYYLTGFDEPDAVLFITGGEQSDAILFNRPKSELEERWTGPRLGQIDAPATLGVDAAYPIAELETRLPEILLDKRAIYYPMGRYPAHERRLRHAWSRVKGQARRGQHVPEVFADIMPILAELRMIKDDAEISCMREAARISVKAHEAVMRACKHARYEYELEAEFLYALGREGCQNMAYSSIVAGGSNACVLHYINNNQALEPNQLVLVDAGGEVGYYAADITRTYPVNGKFSPEQRLLYDVVWRAQKAGIACVKPGMPWESMQAAIVHELTLGLCELGILNSNQSSVDKLIELGAYKPFYMHSSGHWLGLDVHDVGAYVVNNTSRLLEPGMALTVEPGLYIPDNYSGIDPTWWGIGIRIEDDILVTQHGHDNLTGALAVAPEALEDLIRG